MRAPLELRWYDREQAGAPHEVIWPLVFTGAALIVIFAPGLLLPWGGVCPFKHVTGLPCVGCGGTRAARALAHLDLAAAFRWNPLAATALLVAAAFSVYAVAALVFRTRRLRLLGISPLARGAVLVAVVLNWAWLVVDGR